MSKLLVISVMSKDRPGIIADITGAILALDGDLADLRQSVLGGYFTMILIAEFDERVTVEDVYSGFRQIDSETRLETAITEMDVDLETEKAALPAETFVVTAQAENRKGLVKVIGDFFYARNINVLDLVTARDKQRYTMIFQVDLSEIDSMQSFRKQIEELAEREDLDLVFQHYDIFKATHEVGVSLEEIGS